MKLSSTLFLRFVIVLFGVAMFALCTLALPPLIASDKTGLYRPILLGLYVPAIPFFFALYQSMKLLNLIDKNKVFSDLSVDALKKIKYSASAISILFAAGMPYIYYAAERDDAPGVILIGLVFIFASMVIATAAALFQRLLQNAVDMKSENDLTV